MGLRRRIVLPFLALFTLATAVMAVAAVEVVTRSVEDRLRARVVSLSDIVSTAPTAIYQASYAEPMRTVYQAHLAVFKDRQPTALTSLPQADRQQLENAPFWPPEDTFTKWQSYLAIRHKESFLFYPATVIEDEKAAVVRPLLVIAGIGLAAVALFGVLIGHSVARPLETIAAKARGLGGDPGERLPQVGGGPELRELVDALNRMLETLRQNEQLAVMGRLAAGVAHEIKNPLSAMKMTLQMLRQERPEREREPYDLVLREIERLDLAASELSSVARPLAKSPCALDRTVAEVLDLLKPQLDHLGVKVERRLVPGAPVAVDEPRFKRAVMNLILNGAQAMPQGGTLTVELSGMRFAVTDTGTGIAPELRGRIFEPFVTGKADGVGLGLALTKRIVEDHGGKIGFETSEKGSTFWIQLPG